MKKSIPLLFAVSNLVLADCCTTHQATKWEYMQKDAYLSDAKLNEFADEGWSVVSVTTGPASTLYVFKRPKQ